VNTLLASFILLITIVLSVAVGVMSGYAVIAGILHLFAHRTQPAEVALVPEHVSGD
jgi:uncharacterized membrane protein